MFLFLLKIPVMDAFSLANKPGRGSSSSSENLAGKSADSSELFPDFCQGHFLAGVSSGSSGAGRFAREGCWSLKRGGPEVLPCMPIIGSGVEVRFPANPGAAGLSGACQVLLGMRTVNGSEGIAVFPSIENGFRGLGAGVHFPVTSGSGAFSRGATVLLGTSMGKFVATGLLGTSMGRFANVLLADDKEGIMGG